MKSQIKLKVIAVTLTSLSCVATAQSSNKSSLSKEPPAQHLPIPQLSCNNMQGQWINQLGSTLNITQIQPVTGAVTGTYISLSGGGTQEYPLTGWINSASPSGNNVRVISFTVRWVNIGSITSWTGYCEVANGTPRITTLWHLVRPNSQFSWDHIITNSDVFTPKP